jgi:hypothetical protein
MRIKIIEVLPFVESLKLEGRFAEARDTIEKELQLRTEQLGPNHTQGNNYI